MNIPSLHFLPLIGLPALLLLALLLAGSLSLALESEPTKSKLSKCQLSGEDRVVLLESKLASVSDMLKVDATISMTSVCLRSVLIGLSSRLFIGAGDRRRSRA